jgi:hypothetical protein
VVTGSLIQNVSCVVTVTPVTDDLLIALQKILSSDEFQYDGKAKGDAGTVTVDHETLAKFTVKVKVFFLLPKKWFWYDSESFNGLLQ